MDQNTDKNKNKKHESEGPASVEDIEKRRYYYDDAHGYEKFDPENDEEPDDADETDDVNVGSFEIVDQT